MTIASQGAELIRGISAEGTILFQRYDALGRPVLDALHVVFDKAFYFFLGVLGLISLLYLASTLYVIVRKREPYQEQPLVDKDTPFVTVQIPTRNELAAIRCAKRCLAFDYPKDRYEVLIGDDSDNKDVSAKLAAFAAKHPHVQVIKREKNLGYKAGNLNNMLKYSKGAYLVLFDSDFLPGKDFLRRIVAPMVYDSTIAGVQARWKSLNTGQNMVSVLGASIVAVFHQVALPFFNKRRRLSVLCGSAEAVRRDVLEKLGGWQHGSLTEDIEYSLRMLKNGYRIQYLSQLECESEVPFVSRDLYKQQMRWSYGVISAIKDHFTTLVPSRKLNVEDKLLISYIFSGYLLTASLSLVIIFGILSIVTHAPEPINFAKFFMETGRNILVTSGLLLASMYSLMKTGYGKKAGYMIISAFSIGLVVMYYVNMGIVRVLTRKNMPWFLLNKKGNEHIS